MELQHRNRAEAGVGGVSVIARMTGDIQEVNEEISPYCSDLNDQEIQWLIPTLYNL